jgi:teichuronic acid exporter
MTPPPVAASTAQPDGDAPEVKGKSRKYYGRTAKKGAAWSVIRHGGHELVAIPASMFMARLLSPSDFGVAAAATFFMLLAARLTQFGFNAAIVRTKELRDEHLSSVFVTALSTGVVVFGLLSLSAPYIGRFFRSPETASVLPIAALTFLINPFGTISSALLSRRMHFGYNAISDWTDTFVGAIVSVGLAFWGYGYWSIIYGQVSASIARVIVQEYLSGWRPSFRFSSAALRELLGFGLGVQSKRLLEYASLNLDNLVVGRVIGVTSLGLYDKAFTTMNRLVMRLTLGTAPFRIFSIIHEDRERFRRAYSRMILGVTLLGYPIFTGAIVVAEPLFRVLYGDQWVPAVLPFQLLCAGGMMKLLTAYSSQANEAAGNIWPQVRRQAIGAVLVVVGAAVGSLYGGVAGAALGVSLAMFILTAAMQELVRELAGLSWREMIAPQVPGVCCSAVLAGLLLAVDLGLRAGFGSVRPWESLLVQSAVGALFYVVFLLFSPFSAVRDIVSETVNDLMPAWVPQMLMRPLKRALRAQA